MHADQGTCVAHVEDAIRMVEVQILSYSSGSKILDPVRMAGSSECSVLGEITGTRIAALHAELSQDHG